MRIRRNADPKIAAKLDFGNPELAPAKTTKNKKNGRELLYSLYPHLNSTGLKITKKREDHKSKLTDLKQQTLSLIASVKNSFLELLTPPTRKIANDNLELDYIIPISNVNEEEFPYRLKAIQTLINHLPSNVHLILAEQIISHRTPTYGKSLLIPEHITYTWKKVSYPTFNKAWLNNIAARISKTPHLIFAESDMVVDEKYINALIKFIKQKNPKWAVGWNHLIYWHKDMKSVEKIHWHSKCAQGGLIYFHRNFYWKVGGFNEAFENLGGIDNEMYIRSSFYVKPKKLIYTVHHMWHPASKLKIHRSRKKNVQFYKNTKNQTRDINKKIQLIKHQFGAFHKPYISVFN